MKYLWAYSIPFIGLLGIYYGGFWMYSALIFAFVLIPILELLLPIDANNYSESAIKARLKNRIFDMLLYLNVPLVYGTLFYSLHKVTSCSLTQSELIGLTLSKKF